MHRAAIAYALASAALFGASTPLAKLLVGEVAPLALAGLLYLGSGIGLCAWFLLRMRREAATSLSRADWPWLAGAIAAGGIAGPALLMFGLARCDGANGFAAAQSRIGVHRVDRLGGVPGKRRPPRFPRHGGNRRRRRGALLG
jgi:hypothetical protein